MIRASHLPFSPLPHCPLHTSHSLEIKGLRLDVPGPLNVGTSAKVPPVLGVLLLADVVDGDGSVGGAGEDTLGAGAGGGGGGRGRGRGRQGHEDNALLIMMPCLAQYPLCASPLYLCPRSDGKNMLPTRFKPRPPISFPT